MSTIYSNNETVNIDPTDDLVLYKEEFVNSRIEKFLYAICALDFDDLPTPLSRIEELYKCLATGLPAPTFVPQSRVEKYLMAILGGYDTNALPAPQSRTEVLLNKILLGDTDLSDIEWLKSRYEFLLAYIAKSGETSSGPDGYYVDYSLDNSLTTLYNTLEYPVKSAVLKGNTIKNLHKNFTTSGVVEIAEEVAKLTNSSHMLVCNTQEPLANNTQYLIKIEILNNTASRLSLAWRTSSLGHFGNITHNLNGVKGVHEIVATTPANGVIEAISFKNENSDGEISVTLKCVIIPYQVGLGNIPFFDGLCSVKMPVLKTVGKNLFDEEQTPTQESGIGDNVKKVILNENTTYTYSSSPYTGNVTFRFFDCYDAEIARQGGIRDKSSFVTPGGTLYAKVHTDRDSNIQIEEGLVATQYEPHKSTTVSCNEEVELGSVGDVKDELNLLTRELTQRTGEIVLDGSEDWVLSAYVNSTSFYTPLNNLVRKVDYLNSMSCDKLVVHTDSGSLYDSTLPNGISAYADWTDTYPNENWIYIKYADSEGYVEKLKQWLSQNPITVQYELAAESVKTVDLSTLDQDGKETELSAFDDITHVIVSSEGLVPTGEITVATKNATDVIDASVMSLRMDDILNSQSTLEESANTQSDDIDVVMLGTTDIYEQLL